MFHSYVVTIRVPPLRERHEDVLLLADYFLKTKTKGQRKELSPRAVQALLAYDMPGNVRELANMIERGILLTPGVLIEPQHMFSNNMNELEMLSTLTAGESGETSEGIQESLQEGDPPISVTEQEDELLSMEEDYKMSSLESQHLQKVLNVVGGNKTKAAQLLGIGVRTLYRKIEEYHIIPKKSAE